jgi:hypothetical protein
MKDDWKQVFPSQPPITAIDILLEPDANMLKHAAADNDRLLAAYPKGFALDAAHRPHITLIQRFVRTADLGRVYDAAGKVFADANIRGMKLQAFKYYYVATGPVGVAGICAKPTPEIINLQADIIAAVQPFTVETGPIGAFTAAHDDPATDAAIIQYVSTFVPRMSGGNFNPLPCHDRATTRSSPYVPVFLIRAVSTGDHLRVGLEFEIDSFCLCSCEHVVA